MSRMHGILVEAVSVNFEVLLKHEYVSHPALSLTFVALIHLSNVNQIA